MHRDPSLHTAEGSCFTKCPDLVTRQISGETVIVPVQGNIAQLDCVFTLNELGSMVWDLLDGRTTVRQLVEAVCERYDVDSEVAARDLLEFLDALQTEGLISPSPAR